MPTTYCLSVLITLLIGDIFRNEDNFRSQSIPFYVCMLKQLVFLNQSLKLKFKELNLLNWLVNQSLDILKNKEKHANMELHW